MKIKTKIVSSLTPDSKLVKQVNDTAILPLIVFRGTVNGRSKKRSLGRPALVTGT